MATIPEVLRHAAEHCLAMSYDDADAEEGRCVFSCSAVSMADRALNLDRGIPFDTTALLDQWRYNRARVFATQMLGEDYPDHLAEGLQSIEVTQLHRQTWLLLLAEYAESEGIL